MGNNGQEVISPVMNTTEYEYHTNKMVTPQPGPRLQRLAQQLPHSHQSPHPLWKKVTLSPHITYAINVRHSIGNANSHSPIIHRSHPRHPVLGFVGDRLSTRRWDLDPKRNSSTKVIGYSHRGFQGGYSSTGGLGAFYQHWWRHEASAFRR